MEAILGFAALFVIYIAGGIVLSKAAMFISSIVTDTLRNSFGKYKGNSN